MSALKRSALHPRCRLRPRRALWDAHLRFTRAPNFSSQPLDPARASAKISHKRKRFACNSGFNCLRNRGDFNAWNAVSDSRPSRLERAQIQLDSAQIQLGFAASPIWSEISDSHKVYYGIFITIILSMTYREILDFCVRRRMKRSAAAPRCPLLCMGLFLRFLYRLCRAPPKRRHAGSGTVATSRRIRRCRRAAAAIIRWQVQTAGLGTLASCSSAQNPSPQGSPPRLGISPESRQ
jgi:hypothetical protein